MTEKKKLIKKEKMTLVIHNKNNNVIIKGEHKPFNISGEICDLDLNP